MASKTARGPAPFDDTPVDEARELDSLYSPEYLRDCADEEAREERLAELKRRIELGAYKIDPDSVALHMLGHGDLDDSGN
ncbi:MAG: flagellar biosynthesis anti-sigma factor FlgM [Myxococcota bacterium]